jgi:hypothetical protein
MKKIAISFCFIILSYLMLTGPAHAGWVQTNCVLVKITINSESDGWRWECDLEYLPDPSSGLDSGGGSGNGIDMAAESAANKARNAKELCKSNNPDHSRLATVTSRADSIDRVAVATAIYREDPVLQRAAVSSARRGVQFGFNVTFSDGGTQDFTVVAGSSSPIQESDKGNLVPGDGVATGCPA